MRVEKLLLGFAVICAVLLLLAPLTPRTSWTFDRGGGMRHSAGWDWIAPISGVVPLVGLGVGAMVRPGVLGAVVGAAASAVALGIAAGAALGHWLDLMAGSLEIERWTIYPAPAVGYFAAVAATGMAVSLVLLGAWLRPGEGEW